MNIDNRAADARAAELLGWTNVHEMDFGSGGRQWRGDAPDGRSRFVPAFGALHGAARQLVLALPAERRGRFVHALLLEIDCDVEEAAHGLWYAHADDLFALATATPRQIRDAVLEAMEDSGA